MHWRQTTCGVFVVLAGFFACACGARARSCTGSPVAQDDAAAPGPQVRLVGRFDHPEARGGGGGGGLRFAWSGSSFVVRFTGPALSVRVRAAPLAPHTVQIDGKPVTMNEKSTAYSVRVDDRPPVSLEVTSDRESYPLATGLDPAAPHEVTVMREAEAFAGVHELLGLDLGPGGAFLPPRSRPLRIEVVGDSISCGYGVAGESSKCPFTYATERASLAYGARLGTMLDADVTTVCWSGRGVLRNYDGTTTGTMPQLFELALPESPQKPWSFAALPAPRAVIVNLGTNDFLGGAGQPLDLAAFEDAYVKFAARLREVYPAAWIFVTTSPMLGAPEVEKLARTRLERVVARRTAAGDARIELISLMTEAPHWGCDGHPDADMNARIADRIAPIVRARLGLPATP